MIRFLTSLFLILPLIALAEPTVTKNDGPVRILFLGHESKHHNSNAYYPILAKALGHDAIQFDYHTSVESALGDPKYLSRFDGVMLYANHESAEDHQYQNLLNFIENGGAFLPVHCACGCIKNQEGFTPLVGGEFASHKHGVFNTSIIKPDHPAMKDVIEFEAWDETYVHKNHAPDRTILMVRKPAGKDDNITKPEPWTWVRNQGKGRVFYTASGHDERVWKHPGFHQLLKSGILWAIGDERLATYQRYMSTKK